ncbi:hypothetical protein [Fictibacillus barbaricus]|uniref:CDP-diglyceride synthetase n=1 Tax=Fictibacillus barbaricus TaxID=182136 RepID=A0ABU1U488_9BACL|nr:hypothetical protein [Fictibacillus barbaricus]MDR7074262.1 CDP-diglyceride synthetase [Fictibacillus barbaricus]
MLLFSIFAAIAFYLLTRKDSNKFRKISWPVYGAAILTFMIGLLVLQPETTTYLLWSQFFFLLLLIPIFVLVIREIWQMNHDNPEWLKYIISIPVSLLFIFTLWACWNAFPVMMYIF